jgi:hypothetical protein
MDPSGQCSVGRPTLGRWCPLEAPPNSGERAGVGAPPLRPRPPAVPHRSCHSRATSKGRPRYPADNHGHSYATDELVVLPGPARTHPTNMPDKDEVQATPAALGPAGGRLRRPSSARRRRQSSAAWSPRRRAADHGGPALPAPATTAPEPAGCSPPAGPAHCSRGLDQHAATSLLSKQVKASIECRSWTDRSTKAH